MCPKFHPLRNPGKWKTFVIKNHPSKNSKAYTYKGDLTFHAFCNHLTIAIFVLKKFVESFSGFFYRGEGVLDVFQLTNLVFCLWTWRTQLDNGYILYEKRIISHSDFFHGDLINFKRWKIADGTIFPWRFLC